MIVMPSQYALKLPATRPDRMLSDGPPSRDDVTTSFVCRDSTDVNTFTNSGMIAPASVPQVMTSESFHHSVPSPARSGTIIFETMNVSTTDRIDVSHTRNVSGASKFILSAFSYRPFAMAPLIRYDTPLAMTIMMRITKIQTSSCTCTFGSRTASTMNEIKATPVTP